MRTLDFKLTFLLFTVIILEGYVVLSSELLAIRQTIPYVGSGTDTVSIIIAAVLMPLAFGYQRGGQFKTSQAFSGHTGHKSVRQKLLFNLLMASIFLLMGLSHPLLDAFFISLVKIGIENRLFLSAIYCLCFLVVPVYLLGQTIPLISHYFKKEQLAKITGRILFFSTLGSFLGAVFSTLVLMSFLGVHHTVTINFIILFALIALLTPPRLIYMGTMSFMVMLLAIFLNSDFVLNKSSIVENNKYNAIAVWEGTDGTNYLSLNNNASSSYNSKTGRRYGYIEYIESQVISPLIRTGEKHDILVIGAGAFTFGLHDTLNAYSYVDIDASLKKIAEERILRHKLGKNKIFHAAPARAFLAKPGKKWDVIFLDAFQGNLTTPEHLVTREFFQSIKDKLKPGGVIAANVIASPNFISKYSRNIDNTIRSVFPYINRHVISNSYIPWNNETGAIGNVVYIYRDLELTQTERSIYTDHKNTVMYDKPSTKVPWFRAPTTHSQ